MRWSSLLIVAASALTVSAEALLPINVLSFESAISGRSIERRAESAQFADLAPAEQAQLVYGTPGNHGQLLLANMTLTAPSGEPIVMMERLEGLTTAVDCSTKGDGMLGVTWRDKRTYDEALKNWKWVNEKTDLKFLLIVNHDGCGPDAERAPYRVTDVETDETKLVTTLKATLVPWKEITGTFELDFGKVVITPGAQKRLRIRGLGKLWKGVKGAAKGVVKGVKEGIDKVVDGVEGVVEKIGTGNLDKALELDISHGTPNTPKNVFTDLLSPAAPRLTIDCSNCFIKGKFVMQGTLRVVSFSIKELSLAVGPKGFEAHAEFLTKLGVKYSPDEVNKLFTASTSGKAPGGKSLVKLGQTLDLFQIPVPGAGMSIPGIFNLGFIASIETGFNMNFAGDMAFTAGVKATLPDTGRMIIDLANLDRSGASGFEGAKATPILVLNEAYASVQGGLFFRPKFAIKASVLSVGELSADIKVGLPEITAGAEIAYLEAGGVCPGNPSKVGVNMHTSGKLNIVVGVTATIAGTGGRLAQKELASLKLWDAKKCMPVTLPGGSKPAAGAAKPAASVAAVAKPAEPAKAPEKVPTLNVAKELKANGAIKARAEIPKRPHRMSGPRGANRIFRGY